MALKMTMKVGGQDIVLEGPSIEVIAALRELQGSSRGPTRKANSDEPDLLNQGQTRQQAVNPGSFSGGRNPRGYNRKLALQALVAYGNHGALQAQVQKWIKRERRENLAISSVRHGLKQLAKDNRAVRKGDLWFITADGINELAKLEAMNDGP